MSLPVSSNKMGVRWRSHGGAFGFTPKVFFRRGTPNGIWVFDGAQFYYLDGQPVTGLYPICTWGDYLISHDQSTGTLHRYHIGHGAWDTIGTLVGQVTAATTINGVLWIGGDLDTIDGNDCRLGLASWDGNAWTAHDTTTTSPDFVRAIAGDASAVYVGRVGISGGSTDPAKALVSMYSGGSWTSLTPNSGGAGVFSMTMHSGQLVIGGSFGGTEFGLPFQSFSLAVYNGSSWVPTVRISPGLDIIYTVISYEGRVLAGGNRVTMGATNTSIAAWDGATWYPMQNAAPTYDMENRRLIYIRTGCLYAFGGSDVNMKRGFRTGGDPFNITWSDLNITGVSPTFVAYRDLGPVPVP